MSNKERVDAIAEDLHKRDIDFRTRFDRQFIYLVAESEEVIYVFNRTDGLLVDLMEIPVKK